MASGSFSMLNLKAELHRKKQEAASHAPKPAGSKSFKASSNRPDKKEQKAKCKKSSDDYTEDENELQLRKSRAVLEAKSKLYDRLKSDSRCLADDAVNSRFLVDFQQKAKRLHSPERASVSGKSDEWLEYTDDLGRSRVAIRQDVPSEFLRSAVPVDSDVDKPSVQYDGTSGEPSGSTAAGDWIERRHAAWQQVEDDNVDKTDVHYQDVRFDEARTHGAGYFEFSRDEDERQRQKDELRRMRDETGAQQERARLEKAKRQKKLQERLRKVRDRKRLKLGLTIQHSFEQQLDEQTTTLKKSTDETDIELDARLSEMRESANEKAAEEERKKFVREWDLGKESLLKKVSTEVMTQEEWVTKQRTARNSEFAPPSSYKTDEAIRPDVRPTSTTPHSTPFPQNVSSVAGDDSHCRSSPSSQPSTSGWVPPDMSRPPPVLMHSAARTHEQDTSATPSQHLPSVRPDFSATRKSAVQPPNSSNTLAVGHRDNRGAPSDVVDECDDIDTCSPHWRQRGAQVAPPLTADYFGGERRHVTSSSWRNSSSADMQEAINAGLSCLRERRDKEADKTPLL